LGIDEQGSNFCFGCGGHDVAENLADCVNGTILAGLVDWCFGWIGRALAEEEMPTNTAAPQEQLLTYS
jgi:hypothetical protein